MNEWSERLQLILLVQCGGIGFLLGVLFDVFGAIGRCCRETAPGVRTRRLSVLISDVLFGVAAALVTFFASLAIMDGRLHPLLFVGSAVGFAVQHICIGRRAGVLLYRIGRWIGRMLGRMTAAISRLTDGFLLFLRRKMASLTEKRRKTRKKTEKN